MPNTETLVDAGFLVALFARSDENHASAVQFLKARKSLRLHSIWPVVTEACLFLDADAKDALMAWLERGAVTRVVNITCLLRQRPRYGQVTSLRPGDDGEALSLRCCQLPAPS